MKSLKTFSLVLLLFLIANDSYAQGPAIGHFHENQNGPLDFVENKNQWHEDVLYKTTFEGSNTLFIERQGFTFLLSDPGDLNTLHQNHKGSVPERENINIRQHAYKVEFLNSKPSEGNGIAKRKVYHNYFLGNDEAKWSGNVGLYGKVVQENILWN